MWGPRGVGMGSRGCQQPEAGEAHGVPTVNPSVVAQERKHGTWGQDSWSSLQPASYTSLHPSHAPLSLRALHIPSESPAGLSGGKCAHLNGSSSSSFQLGFGPSAVVVWQIVR